MLDTTIYRERQRGERNFASKFGHPRKMDVVLKFIQINSFFINSSTLDFRLLKLNFLLCFDIDTN